MVGRMVDPRRTVLVLLRLRADVYATNPSYVVRAKFNSFVMASMLGDARIESTHDDAFIDASAWKTAMERSGARVELRRRQHE